MKFGFLSGIGEITPSIFSGLDAVNKSPNFYKFIQLLRRTRAKNSSRLCVFWLKFGGNFSKNASTICALLKILAEVKFQAFVSLQNAVICAYKSGKFDVVPPLAVSPKHPAAKLIVMLKSQNGICFDADIMFSQFVYDKIRAKHFDKNVYFQDGIIFAEQGGRKLFGVMPCFKEITKERFHLTNCEIARGFEALSGGEFDRMFIVAPRNANFSRYIEVKRECGCGGSLRLVPYTISHHIF